MLYVRVPCFDLLLNNLHLVVFGLKWQLELLVIIRALALPTMLCRILLSPKLHEELAETLYRGCGSSITRRTREVRLIWKLSIPR